MQMQCSDHPYKNTKSPGGICAFCLQDKLGKLLLSSSSSSSTFNTSSFFPSTSSSSSPPSEKTLSLSTSHQQHYPPSSSSLSIRAQIPLGLLSQMKMQKKKDEILHHQHRSAMLNRSKSTATPRRGRFLDEDCGLTQKRSGSGGSGDGNGNGGFWSFLNLLNNSSKPSSAALKCTDKNRNPRNCVHGNKEKKKVVILESTEESCEIPAPLPNNNGGVCSSSSCSLGGTGKVVCRSRSVGCGSRSFSGDFFERISTGFGDCTLRRVESHREEPKEEHHHNNYKCTSMKERVKCGGIFGGFNLTSSSSSSSFSSSSSSSSSYWVPASSVGSVNGRSTPASMVHGRNRSWGWALASPLRAFSKPPFSSKQGKKRETSVLREASSSSSSRKNVSTPNFAAIPSLLAVGS